MLKIRISAPTQAQLNSIITVKTLISHPMETGYRSDARGQSIARNIIKEFSCLYNDRLVVNTEFHPAVAANPYFSFKIRADISGVLHFVWKDQDGQVSAASRTLTVND